MHIKKDTAIMYTVITVTLALKMSSLLVFCMLYAGKIPSYKQRDTARSFLQNPRYIPVTYKL